MQALLSLTTDKEGQYVGLGKVAIRHKSPGFIKRTLVSSLRLGPRPDDMWKAEATCTSQLAHLLQIASGPQAAQHQSQVTEAFTQFSAIPDAHNYLASILCAIPITDDPAISAVFQRPEVRGMAGLLLKNRIQRFKEPLVMYREALLSVLTEEGPEKALIRSAAGSIISCIFSLGWDGLLPKLVCHLELGDKVELSVLAALEKICQDSAPEISEGSVCDKLLTGLISLMKKSHRNDVMEKALSSFNQFILIPKSIFLNSFLFYPSSPKSAWMARWIRLGD
jgi:hypothetical protein